MICRHAEMTAANVVSNVEVRRWPVVSMTDEERADAASAMTVNAVLGGAAMRKSRGRSTAYRHRVVQQQGKRIVVVRRW